nr:dihydrodipicolinate synthase family protein [Novosphingobium hassiacum]
MPQRDMLRASDVQGAWAIIPTPAASDAEDWNVDFSVDLDETARAVDQMAAAGVDGIFSLGTFGEGATLTAREKRAFIGTVVETLRGRVPFFGGATSLNTRESIQQMREARDIGVDGVMLGLPMWCQPDLPTAVRFYQDVTAAVPDLAICIYANPEAFKFDFPRPFWSQMAELPQVICSKYLGIANLVADLRLVKGRIRLMPSDGNFYGAARVDPENCTAFWSSGASCGPNVSLRLRDVIRAAIRTGDWGEAKRVSEDVAMAVRPLFPNGSFAEFSKYNIGLEKERMNAAGWLKAGPTRPPYHLVPEPFLNSAREAGRLWSSLSKQYAEERS